MISYVEEIFKLKPLVITLSGGEPLLFKNIFQIVELIHSGGAAVQLNTNGFFIDEDIIKKIINTKIEYVQISVEGTKQVHDAIRGESSYYRAIEACKLLSGHTKLIINTTVSKYNISSIKDMAKNLFGSRNNIEFYMLGLKRFVPSGELGENYALGREGLKKLVELWIELDKSYCSVKVRTDVPQTNVLRAKKVSKIMHSHNLHCCGCAAGVQCLTIRANGDVTPCPTLNLVCGNLKRQSIEDILNHSIISELRSRSKLEGACGICPYNHICGGCRAVAHAMTGDFLASDPECFFNAPETEMGFSHNLILDEFNKGTYNGS